MESMVLTPRLACMASLVPPGARLADIGTDHGKLPITLLMQKLVASAVGSDIGIGPLAHARRNADEHGVTLSLRLAAGLDAVQPEECDTITIAGMGGQTIAEILAAAPWTAAGRHLLLLQPMTMAAELRQWLWANGYQIEHETLCREDRRNYVVLSVRGGGAKRVMPLSDCMISPALLRADGAAEHIAALLRREQAALHGMKQGVSVDPARLQSQRDAVCCLHQALEEIK